MQFIFETTKIKNPKVIEIEPEIVERVAQAFAANDYGYSVEEVKTAIENYLISTIEIFKTDCDDCSYLKEIHRFL